MKEEPFGATFCEGQFIYILSRICTEEICGFTQTSQEETYEKLCETFEIQANNDQNFQFSFLEIDLSKIRNTNLFLFLERDLVPSEIFKNQKI